MSDENPTPGDCDPDLWAAVASHQLVACTKAVPEALELRYAAAEADPEHRRFAGHDDPAVVELEAPYRRLALREQAVSTAKPTRARGRRSSR